MPTKELKATQKHCKSTAFLKALPLFANLSSDETALFSDAARCKTYKKGKHLYLEGEAAQFFYVICNGWVKLYHTTEDGEEVSLAMITKANITGENAIFEHATFASSAQVVEEAQILSIPIALLEEQLRISNQLALNMMTCMVQYQRRHELHLERYFLYSAPQRIGCFLLGLCPVHEQKDGAILALPYDKSLIASTLGMKSATFSRALNILREETGILISGTRVTIDSMERLLKFVDGCYSHQHLALA